jgi:hypothetical protein
LDLSTCITYPLSTDSLQSHELFAYNRSNDEEDYGQAFDDSDNDEDGDEKIIQRNNMKKTALGFSLEHVISNPALKYSAAAFSHATSLGSQLAKANDVDFYELHSSLVHPAVRRYYLIREPKKKNWDVDPTYLHPAFFGSQYERKATRSMKHSIGALSLISGMQREGIVYRKSRGIELCRNIPIEEVRILRLKH